MPRDPHQQPPPPMGARVRNYGQQYPEAITGTATVVGHHQVSGGHIEVDVHTDTGARTHWAETATVLCHPHIASMRIQAALDKLDANLTTDATPLVAASAKATQAVWAILDAELERATYREGSYAANLMPGVPKQPSNPMWWHYDADVLRAVALADALTGYDIEPLLLNGRPV